MPLSRVQINREDIARQVKIKWSDCNYEKPDLTDGNYNPVYSYIYDDSNPNIALRLLFRNSEDATDFENTILRLSMPPIFSWPTGGESRFIYDIHDADPNPKNYKAFLLIHTRFNWRYSDLFYVYRDSDYQFDSNTSRIYFPEVIYTDYISTHVDKCYKPDADKPPRFSHCEKRIGNVAIDFGDPAVAMSFMSSLTNGYELIFSRRSHFITTKVPSRFGSAKSNKGNAEIQLWQKGNTMRLVSRWGDKVEDKWMSMTIPKGGLEQRNDSNRAIFRNLEYDRGRKIDLGNVMAREFSHEKSEKKKTGMITIAFETVRGTIAFCFTWPFRIFASIT